MNARIRRILTASSLSRRLYYGARQEYHVRRLSRGAKSYFLNADEYKSALRSHSVGQTLDLHTADGLTITIRSNYGDASTVGEIFLYGCYAGDLSLPDNPIILDIGGFIGDYSLYAVKRLNARRVIVCEPSPRNWTLLLKNIANNHYEDRIVPVNKAVTDGGDAIMNIDASDENQCMVSAYSQNGQPLSTVRGISLGQLVQDHGIETADLLKMDVEGGEYAIFENAPSDVLRRIRNIVFEYHDIDRNWAKLESVKGRLRGEGYVLQENRGLIWASRR